MATTKTTGKRLRTGTKGTKAAEAKLTAPETDAEEPEAQNSAVAAGLRTARLKAARVPQPVDGHFVPQTPIRYAPSGGGALKTEMPTKVNDQGEIVPNVLTDIGPEDLEHFFAQEAVDFHYR